MTKRPAGALSPTNRPVGAMSKTKRQSIGSELGAKRQKKTKKTKKNKKKAKKLIDNKLILVYNEYA